MIIRPGWQVIAPPHFSDAMIASIQRVSAGAEGEPVDDYQRAAVASCAVQIERASGGLWWRSSAADGSRACVTRAEWTGGDPDLGYQPPLSGAFPAVPDYPRTVVDDSRTALELWDPAAREWSAAGLVAAPFGVEPAVPLAAGDMIRITAAATPAESAPPAVDEALRRLFGYRDQFRPRKSAPDEPGAPHFGAAFRKSGAEEALAAAGFRDVAGM